MAQISGKAVLEVPYCLLSYSKFCVIFMFCQSAVEHISGHAEFTEDGGVMVAGKKYSGTHTLIATGGRPTEPGIPGEEFKYNLFIVCTYFILTEKTPPGTYHKYMYMYMAIMTKLSTPLRVEQY